MEVTHGETHWAPDSCFGCRIQTIGIAPSAMPSRGGGKHCEIAKIEDRKLAKDLESYERMRKQGLRPKATSGASEVESKCESAFEVERGMSAADMARLSPSAQRDEAGARRDIAKGAPEYRRRALEAKAALDQGGLGFHNDGTGRKQGVGV